MPHRRPSQMKSESSSERTLQGLVSIAGVFSKTDPGFENHLRLHHGDFVGNHKNVVFDLAARRWRIIDFGLSVLSEEIEAPVGLRSAVYRVVADTTSRFLTPASEEWQEVRKAFWIKIRPSWRDAVARAFKLPYRHQGHAALVQLLYDVTHK